LEMRRRGLEERAQAMDETSGGEEASGSAKIQSNSEGQVHALHQLSRQTP